MPNKRDVYLIERIHHSRDRRDHWEKVGEFVAGSPWRDGRPVNDETMLEEVQGYRWSWSGFFARVRRPDGSVFETLQAGLHVTHNDRTGFIFLRNRGMNDEWLCVCGAEVNNAKEHAQQCIHNHLWVVSHAKIKTDSCKT